MESLPIINKTFELYKSVVEMNDHLEKRWRYSLGNSLEESILSLLSELVMAKNAPKTLKAAYLIKSLGHLEVSSLKLRLLLELNLVNETKIFQNQAVISEIGKMLGGWLKSVSSL